MRRRLPCFGAAPILRPACCGASVDDGGVDVLSSPGVATAPGRRQIFTPPLMTQRFRHTTPDAVARGREGRAAECRFMARKLRQG
jgi:hypothetical protein